MVNEGFRFEGNYQTYWVMTNGDIKVFYDLDTDTVLPFIEMEEQIYTN